MREQWTITLEPLPDRPGGIRVPVEQRIRQLLKLALRGQRLRCVDIKQHGGPADGDTVNRVRCDS